jgi:hypothetical protein
MVERTWSCGSPERDRRPAPGIARPDALRRRPVPPRSLIGYPFDTALALKRAAAQIRTGSSVRNRITASGEPPLGTRARRGRAEATGAPPVFGAAQPRRLRSNQVLWLALYERFSPRRRRCVVFSAARSRGFGRPRNTCGSRPMDIGRQLALGAIVSRHAADDRAAARARGPGACLMALDGPTRPGAVRQRRQSIRVDGEPAGTGSGRCCFPRRACRRRSAPLGQGGVGLMLQDSLALK